VAAEKFVTDDAAALGTAPRELPEVAPRRAAFLDRDGVINIDRGYVSRVADFEFVPDVRAATAELSRLGFAIVVVTNQAGIGRGMYTEADFDELTRWMCEQFAQSGVAIAGVYHCPHHPTMAVGALRRVCECRKPAPGMLLDAARDLNLMLADSVMFGDKCDDMRAARAAGVGTRVYLGKDGHAAPDDPCGDGAVTLRYASLALAVADPALRQLLGLASATTVAGAAAGGPA
jgi:D-glycero-D-manno-heptose 1,7-bisphosphate phosphatase